MSDTPKEAKKKLNKRGKYNPADEEKKKLIKGTLKPKKKEKEKDFQDNYEEFIQDQANARPGQINEEEKRKEEKKEDEEKED